MSQNKLQLSYASSEDLLSGVINAYRPELTVDRVHEEALTSFKSTQITEITESSLDFTDIGIPNEYTFNRHLQNSGAPRITEEKLMCEIHGNCELTHFCRKCQVPVCQLCRPSLKHKGHRTKRIGVAVVERKQELNDKYIKMEQDKIKALRRNLAFVENEKSNVRTSCDEVVARIRQRCAYMKNVLDTIANSFVKEVYYKKKDCLQQYTHIKKEIESEIKEGDCDLNHMLYLFELPNDQQFLKHFKDLKEKPSVVRKVPNIWKEYVKFDHGRLSVQELRDKFGTVSFVVATDGGAFTYESKRQYGRLSCRTKTSFRCERKNVETDDDEQGGSINSIVKFGNSLWVNSGLSSKHISLLNENGKTIQSLPLMFKVEEITCSKNGELIMTSFRDKVIRKVSNTGVTSDLFNVPYHPKGITTTKDGGYLVCMCESYSTSVCEDSHRLVVKYTSEGDEECIYEYNGEEKLFTRPFRVIENINGDICVIDKTAMGSGQVIIVDRTGLVKTIYSADRHQTNNGHINKIVSRFAPSDIACDKNGRIFIVESDNHKVHLLNKTGSLIGHFLTNESDFFCPLCITTDENNQIWIGNEYGEIKMFTCDWQ
ncbi:uncharacterized protein LOC127714299 [Mytilus californianus]|uniref:uncharacterized protein LOC127714299 n=1 Tax=Mytilus californianus TaxID=6549 RepID=UPI002246AE27|nr:uncharacterized protein LOC127714299 [Mytilus californianus]